MCDGLGFRAARKPASASASVTSSWLPGRTTRPTSVPSRSSTSVGHSLIPNDRPSGSPLPSATLMRRSSGCVASAWSIAGVAARQIPHQFAPNSSTAAPVRASMESRVG
ncbi:MAG: hypothetical protein Q4F67_02390 [Propionibacteriaceae bacterium]|nr:hypothetical protein [Propionibacteriaceae bacterium]